MEKRVIFYVVLLAIFSQFFLLHWNGMFSGTYWWALEAVGGTRSFVLQPLFAFISSAIIFGAIAAVFETVYRLARMSKKGAHSE